MNASVGADERLVVMLEARISEFEKRMRKAEGQGTRTYQNLRRGSRSATRQMEADMNRAAGSINATLKSITGSIGSFGKGLAGGILGGLAAGGVAGIANGTRQMVKGLAEIGNEAKRAGISAQAFQEWKFVAEQNRISVDALVDGFKELSLRADEFIVTGVGPAAEAFTRLGFRAQDLKAKLKDPSALMVEILGKLEGFDKAAQIRIADEIFGGTGGERFVELLGQGQGALEETIRRAHEAGAVIDSDLIARADELDRKFNQLTATVGAFAKRVSVAVAEAVVDFTDLRERIETVFPDEGVARAVLGDEVYDALDRSRDLVDENAQAVRQLDQEYAALADAAAQLVPALQEAGADLEFLGHTEAGQALREASLKMEELVNAFRRGEMTGADFLSRLGEVEAGAQDAFDTLEAGDRIQFTGVMDQLSRLGGVISSVTALARGLVGALAAAAGVDPASRAGEAMRQRHAAEAASMQSLDAMREANERFTESENARNAATSEGLRLAREEEAVRKRAREAGATLTDAEVTRLAQASIAGDEARSAADRAGRGGGKSKGRGDKEKLDEFERDAKSIRERTEALQIEAQVLAAVAISGEDYGDAMAYATEKARLLAAAQQAGRQITPELEAEIDALAAGYARAGQAAEDAADKMEQIRGASERGRDALEDMFGSIIDGSASAKDAVASLLAEIAKAQVIKGIMGLPGMGSLSSVIGGALSFDGGGYTGNASRSGGIDGKGGFLAVMHPRETVVDHTKSTRSAGPDQSGGAVDVRVAVDQNGNLQAFVEKVSGKVTAQVVATNARRQSDQKYLRGGR
ncbi:phage tail tape measure protein [Paracoccus denitrificans]|uniref:phage tail tape measure protein n=1 Tax=Paracoccus denitrificans TaxID=266 RepID=UPI001319EDE1|nr:phage tail tape measure protein [Paracoccus denitrificans]